MNAFTSLILDPYERTARLGPALIVLLPLLLFAITVQILSKPIMTQITALFGACGMIFLLSSMARMLGKAQEVTLYKSWGGMPTTQLLRHRDSIIDPMTKQRYHDFLARKLKITFPTASEEQTNPESADDCYRAGVKWLIGKTRDRKKFNLLAKENILWLPSKWVWR